jgi:hypothetical protein
VTSRTTAKATIRTARDEAELTASPGFRAATARAPIPPSISSSRDRCKTCGRVLPYWTRERIIAAIQRWNAEFGSPPKGYHWHGRRVTSWHPRGPVVRAVFGSWNEAVAAAGFPPRYRRWTDQEILDAFYAWRFKHGRLPRVIDWPHATDEHPSYHTASRRFGSWNAAVRAAGYQPYREEAA